MNKFHHAYQLIKHIIKCHTVREDLTPVGRIMARYHLEELLKRRE